MMDLRVILDIQERMAKTVFQGTQDHRVLRVRTGRTDSLDTQGYLDHKVLLELLDLEDGLATRVLRDPQDQ